MQNISKSDVSTRYLRGRNVNPVNNVLSRKKKEKEVVCSNKKVTQKLKLITSIC